LQVVKTRPFSSIIYPESNIEVKFVKVLTNSTLDYFVVFYHFQALNV